MKPPSREEVACALVLAGLPRQTPMRLRALLTRRAPSQAAVAVARGRPWPECDAGWASGATFPPTLVAAWTEVLRSSDGGAELERYTRAGIAVEVLGWSGYPERLADDPAAPGVLFVRGDRAALCSRPAVAVVGTREATHYGQEIAAELGRGLAEAGVAVVSGLATGIDAAAHRGALASGLAGATAGISAGGLDVVYPPTERRLWAAVADSGALAGEAVLGTPPERWRFPLRNRLIAALADVVVVVESRLGGGAMHTVDAAAERGTAVMAVPGSVRSASSAGTNALIAEGALPARDVHDVLQALDLRAPERPCRLVETPGDLPAADAAVLTAVGWEPTSTSEVIARMGRSWTEVALALERLAGLGWLSQDRGWWQRVDRAGSGRREVLDHADQVHP